MVQDIIQDRIDSASRFLYGNQSRGGRNDFLPVFLAFVWFLIEFYSQLTMFILLSAMIARWTDGTTVAETVIRTLNWIKTTWTPLWQLAQIIVGPIRQTNGLFPISYQDLLDYDIAERNMEQYVDQFNAHGN